MTTVTALIDEMDRQVPPTAPFGTRWQGQARVQAGADAHLVVVAARIDPTGRRREQYSVDGTRVERAVLLRLTCPETECPQAQAVRAQWQAFHGRGARPAAAGPGRATAMANAAAPAAAGAQAPARATAWAPVPAASAPAAEPLMHEVPVIVGRHHCTARPQRFSCFTPCPHHAHPPMTITKTGYDLFEDGRCLGGGLTVVAGVSRPRLPTVQAAQAWVLARHLEALAALGQAAEGPA